MPEIPVGIDRGLTASQLHSYVAQKTCPRLAHFQRVDFIIKPHPSLPGLGPKSDFKRQVLDTLVNVRFETAHFTLSQAIEEVRISGTSLFLAQAKLAVEHPFSMRGSPDLIYLKPDGPRVCLEVWDIKDKPNLTYAQKWRLAFYVYLLKQVVQGSPVNMSNCAGLVHRSGTEPKRTPFALLHFMSWMPHLIEGWRADSMKSPNTFTLNFNCTSCRYFSYCYSETLLKSPPTIPEPVITLIEPESIDMPSCRDDWPSIRSFLQKHFSWPIDGPLTATQVARCLGLAFEAPLSSSLYHDDTHVSADLCEQIWSWCTAHVKNVSSPTPPPTNLIETYLFMQRREWEAHTHKVLSFQKKPLPTRVEQFRAIGPLAFQGIEIEGREISYRFSFNPTAPIAKFRIGDFLKLALANSAQIQEGFSVILTAYVPQEGTLSVQALSGKIPLSQKQLYALDECATDWNAPKIETVLHRLKNPQFRPPLIRILHGHGKNTPSVAADWVQRWYGSQAERANLNAMQKQALLLPFSKNIGLIEGPPGTGKTHLLVWTLIALIAQAKSFHRPIKILVTALSHEAIDLILLKIARTLKPVETVPLWKYGRFTNLPSDIEQLQDPKPLMQETSFILGATGYGVYQLLESKKFPPLFDWVIFDEASQILPAQACLSLVFGKGNALFYGDTQQLPPIVMTDLPIRSILAELKARFDPSHSLRLNETYRMNDSICQFVGRHWYDHELRSLVADSRLELPHYPLFADAIDAYLDPTQPMGVVPVAHEGRLQSSTEEALWIAQAVKRLTVDYAFPVDEIGIISPYRLQNNTLLGALKEVLPDALRYPKIDTVERMQGQEFDLVLFSATTSDREGVHSDFLKDYRRFNVSISRAKKKFLFVASPLFFKSFPPTEKELTAHFPFLDLFDTTLRK